MDAISEADLIVVLDTGSDDQTVQRLRDRGATVHIQQIDPWRFDVARNTAMDFIPEDVDICVSNDLDEIFEKDWRKKLEDTWEPTFTRASYLFTWSYHADGRPNKQFRMEKIHRRHGFRWVHPVHEVLEYSGSDPDQTVWIPGLVLNHYPDLSKPRTQYLPLLELSAQENPEDDRTIFWLGREYMYYQRHDECIQTLKNHLSLRTAVWDEERCASMRFIAASYLHKHDPVHARNWLYKAIAECPHVREPYVAMARLGYMESDWTLVYAMCQKGLEITQHTGSYLVETESWGSFFYDYSAIACYRLEAYQQSCQFAKQAVEMQPQDQRLKQNLEIIQQRLAQ